MPSKARRGRTRPDKAGEAGKEGKQLAELVPKAELLLLMPGFQAGAVTEVWRRAAKEVRGLAWATDPHLKGLAAIGKREQSITSTAVGDHRQAGENSNTTGSVKAGKLLVVAVQVKNSGSAGCLSNGECHVARQRVIHA